MLVSIVIINSKLFKTFDKFKCSLYFKIFCYSPNKGETLNNMKDRIDEFYKAFNSGMVKADAISLNEKEFKSFNNESHCLFSVSFNKHHG